MTKWPYILTKAHTCRALDYVPSTATRWGNKPPQHVRVALEWYEELQEVKAELEELKEDFVEMEGAFLKSQSALRGVFYQDRGLWHSSVEDEVDEATYMGDE